MAPAGASIVLEYLDWLSAHKRMENDLNRMIVLKRDCADVIGLMPEYAVALGIIEIIEGTPGAWWPTLDEITQRIEKYMVSSSPVSVGTNASQLAKERFGEALAQSWFSAMILEDRTLYGFNSFICDYVRTHYLEQMRDVVDDIVRVKLND